MKPAFDVAKDFYKQWGTEKTFMLELATYLKTGMVFVRPDLFMMAKIVDINDGAPGQSVEPVWYIRMAVGDLSELLRALPVYLPKVCFTRHGDMRLRMYSMDRIARFVAAKERN